MKKHSSFIGGVILILFGMAILLHQFHLFDFYYLRSYGLFIVGILFLIQGISRSSPTKIYFSTLIALIGFYYILDVFHIVDARHELNIPVYTIIFGLSFYPLILFGERKLNYLLFGNLITLIGVLLLFWHFEVINHFFMINLVDRFWPIIIILFGLIFLINAFQVQRKKTSQNHN